MIMIIMKGALIFGFTFFILFDIIFISRMESMNIQKRISIASSIVTIDWLWFNVTLNITPMYTRIKQMSRNEWFFLGPFGLSLNSIVMLTPRERNRLINTCIFDALLGQHWKVFPSRILYLLFRNIENELENEFNFRWKLKG